MRTPHNQLPENIDAIIRERLSSFELTKPAAQTSYNIILARIEAQQALKTAHLKRCTSIIVATGIAGSVIAAIAAFFILLVYFYPNFIGTLRLESIGSIDFSIFKQSFELIASSPAILYAIPFTILLTIDSLIRRHKKEASSKQ